MDSQHEEENKGPDFGGIINSIIEKSIRSPEWEDYQVTITFSGRQLCRGFEAKEIKITPHIKGDRT